MKIQIRAGQRKKKKKNDSPSKFSQILFASRIPSWSLPANISANVSRKRTRRTESTSISKIEPFDSTPHYYAVRFRTRPFRTPSLSLLPPLVLHAAKAFSSNVFSTTFRHSNHVSFLPPTFPRFFPATRRLRTKWETPPIPLRLHRGISIYLLVFKVTPRIQRDIRHFETWIRENLQRDAVSLHPFHNFFPKRNCSIEKKTSRILFFTLRNIFQEFLDRYPLWILVSLYKFCICDRILPPKRSSPKILPYYNDLNHLVETIILKIRPGTDARDESWLP